MKVLSVEDHAVFREGLELVLDKLQMNIHLLEAKCIETAKQVIVDHANVELILLDLHLPGGDGFQALEYFSEANPSIPSIVLSASTQRADVEKALQLGAMGYICKSSSAESIRSAVKLVISGEIYIPYEIMHEERRKSSTGRVKLTPRQQDVMALVIAGYSNKIIADRLNLAEATIKMHLSAIFEKLSVQSRSAAIAQINKMGIRLN